MLGWRRVCIKTDLEILYIDLANNRAADDTLDASYKDEFAAVGEVTVQLRRCRQTPTDVPFELSSKSVRLDRNSIPEKALKGRAISNQVK